MHTRTQVALLRQYLDYSEASRKRIGHTGFIQALLRDTVEVVDNGYMRVFDAVGSLGMILCLVIWSSHEVPAILPLMLVMPLSMVLRLYAPTRNLPHAYALRMCCYYF